MTKKQINKAIEFIDNKFSGMTKDEAANLMAGDGFYHIFETAIDQAFDNPKAAADWWYGPDSMALKEYEKIHDHYLLEHGKMWKRLHPEQYRKPMKFRTKFAILRAVKKHFKQYPNGSVEISYSEPIPASGEIGTFCYDYRTFKFELGYAMSQNVDVASILFKY